MVCNDSFIEDVKTLSNPIIWITGGFSKETCTNEIVGFNLLTKNTISTNLNLNERQCHLMAPLSLESNKILIGFGWRGK